MLAYYLPLGWFYKTRIKKFSFDNIMRIFMNYFFVVLVIVLIKAGLSAGSIISYVVAMLCMFSVYECGYIFNDVVTVQYEDKPTFRLRSYDELKILEKHIQNLITIRIVYLLLGILWFKNFSDYFSGDILVIVILSTFLLVAYSIHNYVRSHWNALSFFCVINFKYVLPLSFFMTVKDLILVYPVVFFANIVDQSFLTFVSKSYINLGGLVFDRDKFRAIYFFSMTLIMFVFYVMDVVCYLYVYMFVCITLYRLIGYYLTRKNFLKVDR